MSNPTQQELDNANEFIAERLAPFIEGKLSAAELVGLSVDDLTKLSQLGISAYSSGLDARALKVFDAIADLKPDFYMPHQYIGMLEEKAGNLKAAVSAYERAGMLLEQIPNRSADLEGVYRDVEFLLAQAMLRTGDVQNAAIYLLDLREQGDRLDPTLLVRVETYLQNIGVGEA